MWELFYCSMQLLILMNEWMNEILCLFPEERLKYWDILCGQVFCSRIHLDMSLWILCNVQWWENGGGGSILCSLFGGSWWCRWREVAWYFWSPFCLSLLSLDIIYGPKKVRCKSTWSVKSDLQDYAWQRWCLCIVECYASIQTKLSLLISFLPYFKAW